MKTPLHRLALFLFKVPSYINYACRYLIYISQYIYWYIKREYIYYFYGTVEFFENVVILWYGEEVLEKLWAHWDYVVYFYTSLWYLLKDRLYKYLDTVLLVLIWKIKRSKHPIVKLLKAYLSRFPWFNNTIIKF